MAELATLLASTLPTAGDTDVSNKVLGVNQAGALKMFPTSPGGQLATLYITTTKTLALSDTRSGILTSTSAGSSVITIPTFATLGWTRDTNNPVELFFFVQREGDGPVFVNGAAGVTIADPEGLDPQYLAKNVMVCYRTTGNDAWVIG